MYRSCFLIYTATLYLLIGAFNIFTFKGIFDRYVVYCHFSIHILISLPLLFKSPFNISWSTGLVMMNSFSFFLSGNLFICPSMLGRVILVVGSCFASLWIFCSNSWPRYNFWLVVIFSQHVDGVNLLSFVFCCCCCWKVSIWSEPACSQVIRLSFLSAFSFPCPFSVLHFNSHVSTCGILLFLLLEKHLASWIWALVSSIILEISQLLSLWKLPSPCAIIFFMNTG